jgi:DNA-binding response OmpR family regulator
MQPLQPRTLCIEDDIDTCEVLAFVLARSNYDVEIAHTFADGFNKALSGGFQAILLDSHLPDGSGKDLCRQIRQIDQYTPIIFYSADAFPAQIEEAMKAGATTYLTKPIDPFEVEQTIARLLQ